MVRFEYEITEGIRLVLAQDETGEFIRLLANRNGRPTFITPKTPVNLGTLEAYAGNQSEWTAIQMGDYEIILEAGQINLRMPTWRTVATDRSKFKATVKRFIIAIECRF